MTGSGTPGSGSIAPGERSSRIVTVTLWIASSLPPALMRKSLWPFWRLAKRASGSSNVAVFHVPPSVRCARPPLSYAPERVAVQSLESYWMSNGSVPSSKYSTSTRAT